MLSKIRSMTAVDWLFIAIFDLVVFWLGYRFGPQLLGDPDR